MQYESKLKDLLSLFQEKPKETPMICLCASCTLGCTTVCQNACSNGCGAACHTGGVCNNFSG